MYSSIVGGISVSITDFTQKKCTLSVFVTLNVLYHHTTEEWFSILIHLIFIFDCKNIIHYIWSNFAKIVTTPDFDDRTFMKIQVFLFPLMFKSWIPSCVWIVGKMGFNCYCTVFVRQTVLLPLVKCSVLCWSSRTLAMLCIVTTWL